MPVYKQASFSLNSVDHESRVLLSEDVKSISTLLGTSKVHEAPEQLTLKINMEGEQLETTLFKGDGAIKNHAVISKVINGETVSKPLDHTFHSYKSEDKKWRFNFIDHQKAEGLVTKEDGVKYHFVIENGEMKVDTNVNSYFAGEKNMSGRKLRSERVLDGIDHWDNCHAGQNVAGLTSTQMGAAIGNMMFKSYGEDVSMTMINNYIDLSNDIYEEQMDITLEIADVFVSESVNDAPFNSANCATSISTQLTRIRTWSKPTDQAIWHLFDDCFGFSGTTLGIAYLGALCESFNVGVSYLSEGKISTADYPTWGTVAHEIGHNFDAAHSFEEGQGRTGGIMDYGPFDDKLIDGVMQFNSKYRETEVCDFVDTKVKRGCLISAAEVTTPVVNPELTVQKSVVDCQKHRHRVFAADRSNVLERVSGVTLDDCDLACSSSSDCAGFTFRESSGLCKLFASVSESDMQYALDFDSYICASNSRSSSSIHEKTLDDLLDEANVSELKDACCVEYEGRGFLGMNEAALTGLSLDACEAACIQSSHCSNAVFTIGGDCLFYGADDFPLNAEDVQEAGIKTFFDPSMTTLTCDRTCVNELVQSSETESSNVGVAVGASFGVVAAAGVLGAVYYFTKSKKK